MPLYSLDHWKVKTPDSGRYWIAPSADVIGRVELEEDVGIWFGVVIRGDRDDIRICRATNIQDASVLHTDPGYPMVIGPEVTIGHKAMLHGCTIGRGSLIGIGAIALNGARIGEECLIGAGALIPEGKEIPQRSLVVGQPGRVVRSLKDDEIERIKRIGAQYVERWKQYAAGMRRQDEA